ncbi:hypothetical protein QOZ96_000922 [Brevundimonas nasdae]|jgi:Protein of unknown function (DUF3088)|uniref:DUF3088 family protein n=1 Tax=Brevundimonas nasdae TaxID=172043 RepID=UPI0019121D7E|nr:DUF3088 family protein [Brevundimonas nasdae]MBK6024333.1 DUF3088 family protein [Brevundimonas nasdae]MDQ0450991.1 hypothetical protein [Brevundimonas nasdae]
MTDAIPQRADLFLLTPGFEDPAFPGAVYFDRYSALLEGVLHSYPHLEERIRVHRIAFERPRAAVAAIAGEQHQTLPRLVLPVGVATEQPGPTYADRRSVAGAGAIIACLVELYGIAPPHP